MNTPYLQIPPNNDKYFIRIADGGYSPCIAGKPKHPYLTALANCVGYVWGEYHRLAGSTKSLFDPVNAEGIYVNAKAHGLPTGTTPKVGAIICWSKGDPSNGADGAGHVAIVAALKSDGSIVTAESGYNSSTPFWTTTRKPGGNWGQSSSYKFQGFIYLPNTIVPRGTIRRGDTGDNVTWLQGKLVKHGYLRKNEIDGDFGTITFGAVLAFQFDKKLEVDGIVGTKTQAALDT